MKEKARMCFLSYPEAMHYAHRGEQVEEDREEQEKPLFPFI